ncbi:hypothetical protein B0H16DRAFT_1615630 [Mycena metata]|uniref:Uncharacterized protein n=1 Tax=Mycena metata TaxID=1033252 RepID=A0AAD7HA33_9AGAR|nr:hypothetical protein B0H16DRAFT_1615630 [Mycena metata]
MAKHKSEAKKASQDAVLAHLCEPDHLNALQNLNVENEEELNAFRLQLDSFFSVSPIPQGNFQEVIRYLLNITTNQRDLKQVLQLVSSKHKEVENNNRLGTATHRQKRSLVYSLKLQQPPISVDDILAGNPLDPNAPRGSLQNPRIVWRQRDLSFGPGLRTVLADTHCRPYSRDFVCDEAAGFYICDIDESAVFLDRLPSEDNPEVLVPTPTLVVLRGVFGAGSPESAVFLAWLKNVVDVAVQERRDVRPDAPGKMVQVGFNAGPRHVRVFGLAKSYTKQLDDTTKVEHDNDIIAAATTVWAAAKTWLPTDITHQIDRELEKHSMPRIATRNVEEGTGFVLDLNGVTYSFPDVQRAPPEAYLTVDYSASLHLDPCFVKGACAISVNVDRTVDPSSASPPVDTFPAAGQTSNTPFMPSRPSTRSQSGPITPKVDPATEHPARWPIGGGGNFVEMSLMVVVKQATGTLLAFDPSFRHGTTRLCGGHNHTITIAFSAHIKDAFEYAKNGFHESGAGAGDGNCPEFVQEEQ